ncbi:MAG: WecB/TagA/CpsF family glycosyltransferase [Candidatus Levybacteria bacterium]|nr:WecB/TagA/CpsF family glycosyltransferase [Candidatus Levybacteria bacterium]
MKIKDIVFRIEDLGFKEALEYIVEKSQKKDEKTFVITVNPEIIMLARSDAEYEKVLMSADLALADGVGVLWAGKMFGKSFKGRSHGVDLVDGLVKGVAEKPITVGFLGGEENVAQSTADCLKKKYPELKVSFALKEWPDNDKGLSCDILFVAFGSPKQEEWIFDHMKEIDSKVFIGVGGAFDFISGKVMRAPIFIRRLGLEWLFRLMIQPWRIKRQFALVRFVLNTLQEKLK